MPRLDRLDDNNFLVWSQMIKALLIEKDLLPALSKDTDLPAEMHQKAVALMMLHVSTHLMHLVDLNEKAYVIFDRIAKHFANKQTVRVVQLKREFCSLKLQPKESKLHLYSRSLELQSRMVLSGSKVSEEDLKVQILSALPDEYLPTIEAVDHLNSPLSEIIARLETTGARLLRSRQQQQQQQPLRQTEGLVLSHSAVPTRPRIDFSNPPRTPCPTCGQLGHWGRDCPEVRRPERAQHAYSNYTSSRPRSSITCFTCGKTGHIARECRAGRHNAAAANTTVAEGPTQGVAL